MIQRKIHRSATALACVAGVTLGVSLSLPAQAGTMQNKDLAAARAATAQYHNESTAIADGYHATDECVAVPDIGAMGYHYVNFELFGQPLDVRKPAALIYQPNGNGGRKLVAVEYFAVDEDQDLSTDDDKPSLFGVEFDGPMEGHEEGMPVHYDLHVWVWQHNPAGMFEQFNPAGSC